MRTKSINGEKASFFKMYQASFVADLLIAYFLDRTSASHSANHHKVGNTTEIMPHWTNLIYLNQIGIVINNSKYFYTAIYDISIMKLKIEIISYLLQHLFGYIHWFSVKPNCEPGIAH